MRALHIGHVPLPQGHPLGNRVNKHVFYPGRWVLNLAKAQREHTEVRAEVLTKVPGGKGSWSTEIEGVPCHFISTPDFLRGKTRFFLDQRILSGRTLELRPEIVHAHGTEEANALAALRTKLPSLLTLQGCFFIINRTLPPKFFSRQWIVERLERRTIPRFAHVIAKSEYIQNEVERQFPNVQTHLIPNTYDARLEDINPEQRRDCSIAFVGTIDPRKGFDLLVGAFRHIQSCGAVLPVLHVFGNHYSPGKWEASQITEAQNILGDQLFLHGQKPQIELAHTVAKCRALVAPSREEMFGNQIIEALLVGTHVIVTDRTAMAENVRRFGNGTIVPQEDPAALAEAVSNAIAPGSANFYCSTSSQMPNGNTSTRDRIAAYMGPQPVANSHLILYKEVLPP